MPNYTKENMGEYGDRGSYRAFRTITDRPPQRSAVVALPEEPPPHFGEAVREAGLVHILGPDQEAQAEAITYGVLPDVRRGRLTWAADLTGTQVTDDLAARAIGEGYGVRDWPMVSPTRLVAFHDSAQAAQLIVQSMERNDRDNEIDAARVTHLTNLFDIVDSDVPILGQAYNAVGVALRVSPSLEDSRRDEHHLEDDEEDRIRDLYATSGAQARAEVVLRPLHEHLQTLIRDDSFSEFVEIPGDRPGHILSNYGVLNEPHSLGPVRRILVGHFNLRIKAPETASNPHPQTLIIAGAEHAYPDTLRELQTTQGGRYARTFLVFGGVNETTKRVITPAALTGSVGGVPGIEAKEASEAYGNSWKAAITAKSEHTGSSGPNRLLGGDGKTAQASRDETKGFDYRPDFPEDKIRLVDRGTITLAQGTTVWRHVPLAPPDAAYNAADDQGSSSKDAVGEDSAGRRFSWKGWKQQ